MTSTWSHDRESDKGGLGGSGTIHHHDFEIEEFTKVVRIGGIGTRSSEFKFHIEDEYRVQVTQSAEKHRVALTTCLFFAFGTIGMAMSSLGPVFLELGESPV